MIKECWTCRLDNKHSCRPYINGRLKWVDRKKCKYWRPYNPYLHAKERLILSKKRKIQFGRID